MRSSLLPVNISPSKHALAVEKQTGEDATHSCSPFPHFVLVVVHGRLLQYTLVELHGCTHVTRILLQERRLTQLENEALSAWSALTKQLMLSFNNFLECNTLQSGRLEQLSDFTFCGPSCESVTVRLRG